GIEDFVTRPDLVDRAILLTPETIPEENRRLEKELGAELDQKRPKILGALLDAMVHGLRELPNVRLARLPRMADFALWVTAFETAFGWQPGTFAAAYEANRGSAVSTAIAADLVATAVQSFMDTLTTDGWVGTATSLLETLAPFVPEAQRRGKA